MQVADIAVNSSLREGFSVALVELMAMGMPLVVTDVGGNSEAVQDGVCGIVLAPANVEALADGVERVVRDESLAMRYGAGAKRVFEQKFTQAKMVENYDKLYSKLLL